MTTKFILDFKLLLITCMCFKLLSCSLKKDGLLKTCHGKYGCFSVDYPWFSSHRVVNAFPRSDTEIHPNFLLYTRSNPKEPQELFDDDQYSLHESFFKSHRLTYVLTHGYLEHGNKDWIIKMKDEFLKHGDHNIIIVSWLGGSRPPYTQATANTRMVGVMTAHLLKFLHDHTGMSLMKTHVIGHSLGAHLSGYVGESLQRDFNLELGRITGLDPADPHFEDTHPVVRLDESDAYYVDVIHTDASPLLSGGLGLWQQVGHLDFYPNGGRQQAGCKKGFMDNLVHENGNFAFALRRTFGCNHIRAYEYFTESINSPCKFVSVDCPSFEAFSRAKCGGCSGTDCEIMGLQAFSNLHGERPRGKNRQLYLLTQEDEPFCAVHFKVTIALSDTKESKIQGGDRGNFYMILHGETYSSIKLRLNAEETYFEPGRVYNFIAITNDLGHVHSADLIWEYAANAINPLTWRVSRPSKMFVNRVEITQFGHPKRHTFCADDKPFLSGVPQNVIWKPTCRDNAPDPGHSLLGALLNADPVGNAKYVLDQVNPLNANPLNGLKAFGGTFTGLAKTMTTFRNVMRNRLEETSGDDKEPV